jgi:hypothetical protein
MKDLAIVIHSFNGYQHVWPGCFEAWSKVQTDLPIYFCTDFENHETDIPERFKVIYSGVGEWSDRLRSILRQIPEIYVLYMQEDHWPKTYPGAIINFCYCLMNEGYKRIQISSVNQFYTLTGSGYPLLFHNTSKYLVSHQPSIWDKDFFISCLPQNETPWINEYEGTKRLNGKKNKIGIWPCDWYDHKVIKGKLI